MKVVLNSDLIFHKNRLVRDELVEPLRRLCETCRDGRHEIVVPLTTRLEFDRYQSQMAEKERAEISRAYQLLDRYGVEYKRIEPEKIAPVPDLIALMRKTGATVTELEPTADELREAHRRAALHLAPHPPSAESEEDEMRDLVIWMQAVSLARRDGSALLASRDKVHSHVLGEEEATKFGLGRVTSLDDAVEHLEVRTPAGRRFESLLRIVWADLVAKEPKLPRDLELRSVQRVTFVEGQSANATIRAKAGDKDVVSASVVIALDDRTVSKVSLLGIQLGGKAIDDVTALPKREWPEADADANERIARLREVLG